VCLSEFELVRFDELGNLLFVSTVVVRLTSSHRDNIAGVVCGAIRICKMRSLTKQVNQWERVEFESKLASSTGSFTL